MNCSDCASLDQQTPAIGMCADCGAGICQQHARLSPRRLTRTAVINRVAIVEPPARILHCAVCQSAYDAAHGDHHRQAG